MELIDGVVSKYAKSQYSAENHLFFDPLMYIQRYQGN